VRTYGEGGRAIFEVHDTGLGMSADEQKKLFGKFYRAESAAVRAQAGTGLGLWITKQMIEAMQGTIAVESIKDVGSRFTVSFPKAG
jgi:two-component system phosphate regulon sensor histidine kinase PhoR